MAPEQRHLPRWLPPHVLAEVFRRLPMVTDRLRAAGVCKAWEAGVRALKWTEDACCLDVSWDPGAPREPPQQRLEAWARWARGRRVQGLTLQGLGDEVAVEVPIGLGCLGAVTSLRRLLVRNGVAYLAWETLGSCTGLTSLILLQVQSLGDPALARLGTGLVALPQLAHLDLGRLGCTGLPWLGQLTGVTRLVAAEDPGVCVPGVRDLTLYHCLPVVPLAGAALGPQLTSLTLLHVTLQGPFEASLSDLRVLRLVNCRFEGSVPTLAPLGQLTLLQLSGFREPAGGFPGTLKALTTGARLPHLRSLMVEVSDSVEAVLAAAQHLTALQTVCYGTASKPDIQRCLRGEFSPPALRRLRSLKSLQIGCAHPGLHFERLSIGSCEVMVPCL